MLFNFIDKEVYSFYYQSHNHTYERTMRLWEDVRDDKITLDIRDKVVERLRAMGNYG